MTPTPKLRFAKRLVPTPEFGENTGRYVHILQQWWVASPHTAVGTESFHDRGEWRDVPVEDEK